MRAIFRFSKRPAGLANGKARTSIFSGAAVTGSDDLGAELTARPRQLADRVTRIGTAAWLGLVLAFIAGVASPAAGQKSVEDEPTIAPTHYTRTLGPYGVDGRNFTVKMSVICHKETKHAGVCDEDDEETVKWVKIEDERGKTEFHKSFPVAFFHRIERHVVEVNLLEGREHPAIELVYEQLPTPANSGVQIQVLALHDGILQPMNATPLDFYGQLGEMPEGSVKGSRQLAADDTLPIFVLTSYFYILEPVRLDWKDFRLRPQHTGEFEVAQEPPFQRKPDIQTEGYIHLYEAPDKSASVRGINVTVQSKVEVLRARFSAGPPEAHSSANEVWLKIRIDGKEGWIIGADEYTAVGLTFYQPE